MTEQTENTHPQGQPAAPPGPPTHQGQPQQITPQAFPQAQPPVAQQPPQQYVTAPSVAVAENQLSTVGKRIGAWLLDQLLALVTLGIGWLIWAAVTAKDGQTPAKQLLKMQAVDLKTGQPLSWGYYVFVRGLVGYTVLGLAGMVTIGIAYFWPLWDNRNQNIAEKVSNSVTVDIG